jgi:hypothetical protein
MKMTKEDLTPHQLYHKALHAMPSAIAFDASVNYGKTNFKYATLKAIRDAVLPVLEAHDLEVDYSDLHIGDRLFMMGQIKHKDSAVVLNRFSLPMNMPVIKMKELGANLSYYRIYILSILCNVVADEDNDCNFSEKAEAIKVANTPITSEQVDIIFGLLDVTNSDADAFLKVMGAADVSSITDFERANGLLVNKLNKMEKA